ncbi:hypothetical protein RvY_15079 [Ramazzottius varieornatus]|uniref:Uncharacterized protein n=1 Tax=Ramazzottius varieornatus TaxID=947166 RepID=A0A1D1VYF9_RAMVA|nr:hypothetical protein RvY_15079 [Ramazzottius varieornatus]
MAGNPRYTIAMPRMGRLIHALVFADCAPSRDAGPVTNSCDIWSSEIQVPDRPAVVKRFLQDLQHVEYFVGQQVQRSGSPSERG